MTWENEVFMEQEETRAMRTDKWLYMKRFQGSRQYPFEDALYNVVDDLDEKVNLIADKPWLWRDAWGEGWKTTY